VEATLAGEFQPNVLPVYAGLRQTRAPGRLPAEAMKFANKYELFEAVTSGRVETFFARDLASGERVLLHIFEAPEQKPDQPTVLWVVESFRSMAPSPPGLVVEAGRYSGTTYAYLVTKLPDNAALQQWTQSYESCVKDTEEIAIPAPGATVGNPAASRDLSQPSERPTEESPALSTKPPGDFTAAFSGSAPRATPPSETSTPREANLDGINLEPEQAVPRREPGDFTKQFFSGSSGAPQKLATQPPAKLAGEASVPPNREVPRIKPENPEAAKAEGPEPPRQAPSGGLTVNSTKGVSPDSGGFTALFRSSFKPETMAPSANIGAPRKPEKGNAGDFTDFFRGPFDGERPAETPNIPSKVMDTPQRNAPGEFTRVFGSGKDSPFAPTPPLQSPVGDRDTRGENEPGFTQLFPLPNQSAAPPSTNAPARTWEPRAPKSEVSPSIEPAWTPAASLPPKAPVTPSIESIPSKPTVSSTLRETEPPLPAGATHVFSAPGGRLASSPASSHSGPSEYTRIISGGMRSAAEESKLAGASQTPAGGPPGFKLPPAPAAPPVPKIAAPPPPKLSPPAAPAAPKPKAAYLPLIIILNVLLFVAILLIMYFAMKH
jgi:hypothetical protein